MPESMLFALIFGALAQSPVRVTIERGGDGYELKRNGALFFVKGANGRDNLDQLAAAGANAVRTTTIEDIEPFLAKAQAAGLVATVTLPVGAARFGFDWGSEDAVRTQRARVVEWVDRLKGRESVLMWSLGSEVEIGHEGDERLWKGLDDLAKAVKAADPSRPVLAVLAEVDEAKIARLKDHCPNLDAIGVNTFAGLATLPTRLRDFSWTKPYFVTEFGPFGPWEVAKTAWGAPREPLGQQKEDIYLSNYLRAIADDRGRCLGSFVYLWGPRNEGTTTWFGMYLASGERLGTIDAMTFAWSGRWPANRCPRIFYLDAALDQNPIEPGTEHDVTAVCYDPDNDPLTLKWEVRSEMSGDDVEPKAVYDAFASRIGRKVRLRAPATEGAYRLYLFVHDGKGNAATANLPFFVKRK